eukprot:gene8222-5923_t
MLPIYLVLLLLQVVVVRSSVNTKLGNFTYQALSPSLVETKQQFLRTCTKTEANALAAKFRSKQNDASNCAKETWLAALAALDRSSNKFMVNIGVNKGYNIANWIHFFHHHDLANASSWFEAMKVVLPPTINVTRSYFGGFCQEVNDVFDRQAPNYLSSQHMTLLAVDLNCRNLELIQNIWSHLEKNTRNVTVGPTSFNPFDGLSLMTYCAAMSDSLGEIMVDCSVGDELCKIGRAQSSGTKIPIMTMDRLYTQAINQLRSLSGASSSASAVPGQPGGGAGASRRRFHPQIDMLVIDTEGNDYLVLQGSKHLFVHRLVRLVAFEYHEYPPWDKYSLRQTVDWFDSMDYDCFFQGQGRIWQLTRCWDAQYEFHGWSNVQCVLRDDPWFLALQPFVVQHAHLATI